MSLDQLILVCLTSDLGVAVNCSTWSNDCL